MKCTLLPQGWIIPGKTLIPSAAVVIALALSACGGSNAPASIVTRTVTASPSGSAKQSVYPAQEEVRPTKAAAAPALLVVPALYGGPAYSGIEPQYVQFSGDAGNIVAAISWSSWTATKATGTGTVDLQGCVPDCASGSETPTPAYLVLSDPVNGKFTAITEYVNGRNDTTMWPEIASQTDPAGEPEPARSAPAAPVNAPSSELPATGVWYPAGFPDVACGPPTAGTDGLNTSYLLDTNGAQPQYAADADDPASSPCNS